LQVISSNKYQASEIFNADETGVILGTSPSHAYVPKETDRAHAPMAEDKNRFTALLWASGQGTLGPPFMIIKCSSSCADLSKSTVLDNVLKSKEFESHWSKKLWVGEVGGVTYARPYLIHDQTKAVITVQAKAWMDTAGVLMWIELQFGPLVACTPTRRAMLVWDNCPPHLGHCVIAALEKHKITMKTLPPNTTSCLQVMDICVNAPLKAQIRRKRCDELFQYFSTYQLQKVYALQQASEMPAFRPPKPSRESILSLMFDVVTQQFLSKAFTEGVQRVFVQVGLVQDETGAFRAFRPSPTSPPATIAYNEILCDTIIHSKGQLCSDGGEDNEQDNVAAAQIHNIAPVQKTTVSKYEH
jgi:hypothetical protein